MCYNISSIAISVNSRFVSEIHTHQNGKEQI